MSKSKTTIYLLKIVTQEDNLTIMRVNAKIVVTAENFLMSYLYTRHDEFMNKYQKSIFTSGIM